MLTVEPATKLLPLIAISVPAVPELGEIVVMVGGVEALYACVVPT
jgi:hypothetical protein